MLHHSKYIYFFRKSIFIGNFRLTCNKSCTKRCTVTSASNFLQNTICSRSLPKTARLQIQPACHYGSSSRVFSSSQDFKEEFEKMMKDLETKSQSDRILPDLEHPLERVHWFLKSGKPISARFYGIITDIALKKADITRKQAERLIRIISSSFIPVPMETRFADLESLLHHFNHIGVKFDVDLYNIRLIAYFQLGQSSLLSVTEEMECMATLGITPDSISYSLFMKIYCEAGDVDSASEVLRTMKELKLKITIVEYNSLIRGYYIAGDSDMAIRLYDSMEKHRLEKNSFTYGEMMVGFARLGDYDKMIKMMEAAVDAATKIQEKHYREVLEIFVMAEQYDLVHKTLSVIPTNSLTSKSHDLLGYMLNHDQLQLAVTTFQYMRSPDAAPFLVAAAASKISADDFEKCVNLLQKKYRYTSLASSCDTVAELRNTERLLVYIDVMKRMGKEVKPSTYFPALCQYGKENNLQGIIDLIPKLFNTSSPAHAQNALDTWNCINKVLTKMGKSFEEISKIIDNLAVKLPKEMLIKQQMQKLTKEERARRRNTNYTESEIDKSRNDVLRARDGNSNDVTRARDGKTSDITGNRNYLERESDESRTYIKRVTYENRNDVMNARDGNTSDLAGDRDGNRNYLERERDESRNYITRVTYENRNDVMHERDGNRNDVALARDGNDIACARDEKNK